MLNITQYGLFISCIKSRKNKPTLTNESGLIIFDNLIIAQNLVKRHENLIIEVKNYGNNPTTI
jgi:hypothetical protein